MNRFITGLNILLVILVAVLGAFLSINYVALRDLIDDYGYTGWKSYAWILCYVWLIGVLSQKVYKQITPFVIEYVLESPLLKLPLPRLRYPSLFNYPAIDRVKSIETKHGIIYIMRRQDGILKFGKTQNLRRRFKNHCKDYEQGFSLVTSWIVPDLEKYEKDILRMSQAHRHEESTRLELRRMTDNQLTELIFNFTDKVYRGWIQ